ncbi:MAG TPA: hypothetical protein VHL57_01675 [Flavobacteriales bacterium]|jgi:hypothetical protein|nr:hypothetical protein [Flavobacteriales bacterium]
MKPLHYGPAALIAALALACEQPSPAPAPTPAQDSTAAVVAPDTLVPRTIAGVKGSAILYSDGSLSDTHLKGLSYVGSYMAPGATQRALLLAERTVDGLTERALYIVQPTDTAPPTPDREHSWNAPGRKLDGETGEPFQEVAVYYGEVLRDTMGVIWYEMAVMPDGQRKENTTLLYEGPKGLDTLVFFGQSRLAVTNRLAFDGKCEDLKGADERQAP